MGIAFVGLVGIREFDMAGGKVREHRLNVGDYVVLGGNGVQGGCA